MKMFQLPILVLLGMLTITTNSYAFSAASLSDAISGNHFTGSTKESDNASTKVTPGKINVKRNETNGNSVPNPALFVEDAAMTAYIHTQLLFKRNIPSVNVVTENAVVSLSGTVDTKEQAATLIKIASSVNGVKAVNTDHLIVRQLEK